MRRALVALFEGVLGILLVFALVFVGGWYVFVYLPDQRDRQDDPAFARQMFAGMGPVRKILEGRQRPGPCSYAIAELDPAAPTTPPRHDTGSDTAFGGDWLPTPGTLIDARGRDALVVCAEYWAEETRARVRAAATAPGGWIARDRSGGTVSLYSRPEGLIAWVGLRD